MRSGLPAQVYATIRYPDGTSVNVKFFNDPTGLRAYTRINREIVLHAAWPGWSLDARKTAGRFQFTLYADDQDAGFTLEHWGECLGCTRNPLKSFRAPGEWEAQASVDDG